LALAHNAAAVIFAHNHPSGSPQPSAMDKALTTQLKQLMQTIEVAMLDHVIVCGTRFWSFREKGLC
jgi:DNA repair protein RadC